MKKEIFKNTEKQIEFIELYFYKKSKECYVYIEIVNYTKEYISVFFYDFNTDESNDVIHSISLNNLLTMKDIIKEFDNFYNDNY